MTTLLEQPSTRLDGNTPSRRDESGGRRPVAIDLFSGAGGLSYGLELAGFDVRLGLDFDKHALSTFSENHSGKSLLADVRQVSGRDLLNEAGVGGIDLLAGGPSCQGFSTHGKRLADDPRNFLYVEFMRIVEEIRPTTVLIENVRGLLSTGRGAYREEIFAWFRRLGYHIEAKVLYAVDFGVPQRRHRVFFLATQLSDSLRLPDATHAAPDDRRVLEGELKPYLTLSDAISDLPDVGTSSGAEWMPYSKKSASSYQDAMRAGSAGVSNHNARPLSDLALGIVRHLEPGQGLRQLPLEFLPDRFKTMRRVSSGELRRDCTTLYHRLSMEEPAYTVTCNFRNVSSGAFTHPTENRSITPREAARIQSFPDRFVFKGSSVPRQIGNAVPPLLGAAVGAQVLNHLAVH